MRFIFTVEVKVSRSEGKFATRDEIAEQIVEALESADPGSYEGDNGGEYATESWDVSEEDARRLAVKPGPVTR
jgi:hypothetical protein